MVIIQRMIWILIFIFSTSYSLFAQEPGKRESNDTLALKQPINQNLLCSLHTDIIVPSPLHDYPIYSPGFFHQSLTNLPPSLSMQFQQQIDVVSPWKQELTKQNEYHTLKTILGIIQVGGTAYFLYEHIKKYGLK